MDKVRLISYQDIDIVYTNLKGLRSKQVPSVVQTASSMITKFPPKSVYSLVDMTNMRMDRKIMDIGKKLVEENSPHIKATAVIGPDKVTKLVVNTMIALTGRNAQIFDNLDEGKAWLLQVSQQP